MKDFTTGWFDTQQANLQAKCNARVSRNFKEIRIDWTVQMAFKNSSDSYSTDKYIDIMVKGDPDNYGESIARIKNTDEAWNGKAEHSINGVLTWEDEGASSVKLVYNSTGNFASPTVFKDIALTINYEEYDPDMKPDTPMPFHSVFTTEEYLQNHKGLIPRNYICNNKS